jgi:hypothetical protein
MSCCAGMKRTGFAQTAFKEVFNSAKIGGGRRRHGRDYLGVMLLAVTTLS